jgi:hypothetical protein
MTSDVKKLHDVVGEAADKACEDDATVGYMLGVFSGRLLGPFLIVAAAIGISPIGGIPGVPSVIGLTIALFSVQFLFGNSKPWIPGFIAGRKLDGDKLDAFRDKVDPWLKWLDKFIHPRLTWATGEIGSRLATLVVIALALLMIPLEALPFAVILPASGILFLGVGITARDGVVLLIGLGLFVGAVVVAARLLLGG